RGLSTAGSPVAIRGNSQQRMLKATTDLTRASNTGIGAPVPRVEDQRLLTGRGRYVDDMRLPNTAYAYVVRSPHAHARIVRIDKAAALAAPGVLAVLTGQEALADQLNGLPCQ